MLELTEKPKNPIIIEGFPGFGFVSTIATEFLIKHLDAKKIGRFFTEELLPMAVVHESKIIDPLEVYYSKKENIIILRTLMNVSGAEWKIAEIVGEIAKDLKAKEIISVEGIAAPEKNVEKSKTYYFTNSSDVKFKKLGMDNLKNGIIMGVTGVLLMKTSKMPISCLFAEATPGLPDSRAAGEIIKALDGYLGLKVDYKPLMKTAQEVEEKVKMLISKIQDSAQQKDKKEAGYLG
jgi:uncharacterized protein